MPRRFDPLARFVEPRSTRWAKSALLLFILVHIPICAMSGYRAVVQAHSLSLTASAAPLGANSMVRADLGSWGRTFVFYDIELEQGAIATTEAVA